MIKKTAKMLISFLACLGVLLGISYAYLSNKNEEIKTRVRSEKKDEPYVSNAPDNCGVCLIMPDDSGMLFYLDFKKTKITVLPISDATEISGDYLGYSVDYSVYADYNLVSGIIDRIGGIDIEENGEKMRLTGDGATELLSVNNNLDKKVKVLEATFNSISKNGLSRDDLVFIISNCDSTELSLGDCFYWAEYLSGMAENITVVN